MSECDVRCVVVFSIEGKTKVLVRRMLNADRPL